MKILQVVSYFPPDRIGGVGEVAAHIHRGLLDAGHDSVVLTTGPTSDDPRVIRVGKSVAAFGITSLRRWKLATGFDVIHFHHGEALLFLAFARLRRSRPRILVTMHVDNRKLGDSYRPVVVGGELIGGGWRVRWPQWAVSRIKALLDFTAMALADGVTFISDSAARDVLGESRAHDATVIHNGLPPKTPPLLEMAEVEPMEVLYVGTAGLRKRTNLLPLLLESIRKRVPGARLRMVGFDLDSQPALKRGFADRGLSKAVLCEGAVRSDELGPYYRSAQVLVVPSAYEGLPMVIMEAFRDGLPCVATGAGGHTEIIEDGVSGFIVPLDDPAEMANRCAEILLQAGRGRSMGEQGKRRVDTAFGLTRQIESYLAHYAELVSS